MESHEKRWRIASPNKTLQEIFQLKLGISKPVGQILVNRGITTLEHAKKFIAGDLKGLYDPYLMNDMEIAVGRVWMSVKNGEKIRIFGDYDVDGITATSVLMRMLSAIGANVDYFIPGRLTDGYGVNAQAIKKAYDDGVKLIITVDNGINAVDEVKLANTLDIDTIITDHHEPGDCLPQAKAVLNPKIKDCRYPFKHLAGVGVAYKLGQALLEGKDFEFWDEIFEMVCLGTIADIVPLKDENRILVKKGLELLKRPSCAGINALIQCCGINTAEINSQHIAFQLAPRINAAGRLGDASLGVRLLLSRTKEEALKFAQILTDLNSERQKLEASIYKEALQMVEKGAFQKERDRVIVLAKEGWHLGVIGIVASKLVQDFYRPVVLLSIDENIAKGSARSVPSFDIFDAFRKNDSYLVKYGGHKQAAGLTITIDQIPGFIKGMNQSASTLTEDDLKPEVFIDCEVDLQELDENLYRQLQMLAPHGYDNPYPVLACRRSFVADYRNVGADESHLKLTVKSGNSVFDAIGFNLGNYSNFISSNLHYDFAFILERNEWMGRSKLQLNIKDIRPCISSQCIDEQGSLSFVDELFQSAVDFLSDDYFRGVVHKDEFYTKVSGVTFDGRQETVRSLYEGEKLRLVREPDNSYDSNAIRVENLSGKEVGYLNAQLAKHLAPLLDKGENYDVYVSQVTGGGDKYYGVNILIQKPGISADAQQIQYLAKLREGLSVLPDDELMERVREVLLGGNPYRKKQIEALGNLFAGYNTLAIFGTGRGKSAVFQSMAAYKAIRKREMTVIVYPLRALVNDQFENMSVRFRRLGLRVFKGNGSISDLERVVLFEALGNQEVDVLLTTPEFLAHNKNKIKKAGRKVGLFVVDESHHIGKSSQAHRPIYKNLGELARELGSPTIVAVTATLEDSAEEEIINILNIQKIVVDTHVRTNLKLVDKRGIKEKDKYLRELIRLGEKTIVYVNSRLQALELAAMLRQTVPEMAQKIVFYHAGLNSDQRNTIEKMFRDGEITFIVSTSAFGEGIDIPDIKHVVVFHLNFNFTEFNQQCGRCGRDGQEALIHILCGKRDAELNRFILDNSSPDRNTLGKFYLILKGLAEKEQPIKMSNEELAKILLKSGVRNARSALVSSCLGILEELELIRRETMGRIRNIYLLPSPTEKVDIENSLRFIEGQEEKRVFSEFEKYFFNASGEDLLQLVNRPIYPLKYAESF